MAKELSASESEKHVLKLFQEGTTFNYNNSTYCVTMSGKPKPSKANKGECKTDIYIKASNISENKSSNTDKELEIKISYKKPNADFLENKILAQRAHAILGETWSDIIQTATTNINDRFENRYLIFHSKCHGPEAGAITLGWRYEIVNNPSGDLVGALTLDENQLLEIYAGNNLEESKRNSVVNEQEILNSGVPDYILCEYASKLLTAQDAIDQMLPITDYISANPNVYFACKAVNYYPQKKKKFEGNRALSVYVDWSVDGDKLSHTIKFDQPLTFFPKDISKNLESALKQLNIQQTSEITIDLVKDPFIIHR
ncbi:hypothetical protein [Turicibacter sanguinis]|uniref:hypothetical protein n=1 Tax=Turicibacter sanguinis TaxID=154288 RepID=UPI0021D4E7E5|nr:hypothetical protein [Turicibacter sanguinis]MCU7202487.1 hypothetical protein [Turicibacter sanguinis]